MQELLAFLECAIRQLPCSLRAVQHNGCTKYIRLYKYFRMLDTSVYMRLRCEMYHAVDIILSKNLRDCFLVADIRLHKCIILTILNVFQILQIPCIRQHIHIDDTDFIIILLKHIMDVIGIDKSGTTSY